MDASVTTPYAVFLDETTAEKIRAVAPGGFTGNIAISASIGDQVWDASLYPHRASNSFRLPLRRKVAKRAGIKHGTPIHLVIELRTPEAGS